MTEPPLVLRRRLLWDIVADENASEYAAAMGLIPASEDVNAEERVAAHKRLALLTPIGAPFVILTSIASDVLTRCLFTDLGLEVSEQDIERVTWMMQSGCQAVIAELLDLQVLTYGPTTLALAETV